MDIPRPLGKLIGELEAEGWPAFLAGGFFHPPARDADVFLLRPEKAEEVQGMLAGRGYPVRCKREWLLEVPLEGLLVQIILPRRPKTPEEVLAEFDLGASQVGLFRGKVIKTMEHVLAVWERRPRVLQVGPSTPSRVLKYALKGFRNYERDFVIAVDSLLHALALMTEEERRAFLVGYDPLTAYFATLAERLAPGLLADLCAGRGGPTVPARFFEWAQPG